MDLMVILTIAVGVLIAVILILVMVYFKMSSEEKRNVKTEAKGGTGEPEEKGAASAMRTYTRRSVFDFMEFDKVEDNMIVQKHGKRYIMVVECQGINYDLMSEVERTSVEQGFMQFLNTLRHPIQIYVQTRTINLEGSVQNYNKRLEDVKIELDKAETEYKRMVASTQYSDEEIMKQNLEVVRNKNLYEYGKDIIYYTQTMSSNKNVLRKNYYVVIPYYVEEVTEADLLSKEEIRNTAFSELYTRAQSIARVLSGSSISSKVLDSYELIDLLYAAYNRDESEVYGIDRALQAGYDELYSTAPDILDKKMQALNSQIEEKAIELATKMVKEAREDTSKAREIKRKEKNMEDFINEMAMAIVNENIQYIGEDTAEVAKEKIEKRKTKAKEKGDEEDGKKEKARARRVAG